MDNSGSLAVDDVLVLKRATSCRIHGVIHLSSSPRRPAAKMSLRTKITVRTHRHCNEKNEIVELSMGCMTAGTEWLRSILQTEDVVVQDDCVSPVLHDHWHDQTTTVTSTPPLRTPRTLPGIAMVPSPDYSRTLHGSWAMC